MSSVCLLVVLTNITKTTIEVMILGMGPTEEVVVVAHIEAKSVAHDW